MTSSSTDSQSNLPDKLMLFGAAAAFLIGVYGYHWAEDAPWMSLGFLGIGLVFSAVLGFLSPSGRRFVGFSREAAHETQRVVWPSRKETLQTTGIVFVFVLVMAIFLWLTDKSLEWILYDLFLGWK